ncbi:MAG: hypothetical protein ACI88H_003447, partial [Cocleimonas sp.]
DTWSGFSGIGHSFLISIEQFVIFLQLCSVYISTIATLQEHIIAV